MNEIMEATEQTPIEIALGIDADGMTTARKLYEFLGMDNKNYSRWVKSNITENQFAEEGTDYFHSSCMTSERGRGNFAQDYKLTAQFAEEVVHDVEIRTWRAGKRLFHICRGQSKRNDCCYA